MNLRTAILAISLALSLGAGGFTCHALDYRSDLLEEMTGLLPLQISARDTLVTLVRAGREVSVRVAGGCVEHAGYRIFTPAQRESVGRSIADFVERYWLSLDLPLRRGKSPAQQMKEDRFTFRTGSPSSVDAIMRDPDLPFGCTLGPKQVSMEWGDPGHPVCAVVFPVDHELILGRRMLENDRRLPGEINAATFVADCTAPLGSRKETESETLPVIRTERGGVYLDCELKHERYYVKSSGATSEVPVFDIDHPVESVMNLFTGCDIPQAATIGLDIRHKTFGLGEQPIQTTVGKFVAYSISSGCVPYVGIISLDKEEAGSADILVIMRNARLGYNHVLRVSLPLACMADGRGTATARLNAFVPSSNILNLFKN